MVTPFSEYDSFISDAVDPQELHTDPMTGLGNLFACLTDLHRSLSEDDPELDRPSFVMLTDIDGLTRINETKGFGTGNKALLLARATLLDMAGDDEHVYRFSRDEFAIVGYGKRERIYDMSQSTLKTYRQRAAEVIGPGHPLTLGVGIALIGEDVCSVGQAISTANRALHRTKKLGGNRACIMEIPGRSGAEGRSSPEADLLTMFSERIMDTLNILVDVSEMALTDPLTGLPNHRGSILHLRKHAPRPEEPGPPTSILLVDGDRLKEYNTRFGYNRGNKMIADLAGTLKSGKRKEDFLARWFIGDEFLLVLPETGRKGARQVAERLRETVEQSAASWEIPITVSIGTASLPDDSRNMDVLINLAQAACAEAKARGKNCVVQSHELDETAGATQGTDR